MGDMADFEIDQMELNMSLEEWHEYLFGGSAQYTHKGEYDGPELPDMAKCRELRALARSEIEKGE